MVHPGLAVVEFPFKLTTSILCLCNATPLINGPSSAIVDQEMLWLMLNYTITI